MNRGRIESPVADVPQIDVDRTFAILDWDLTAALERRRDRARVVPDEHVREVVRDGAVVGWEKGWTLRQTETAVARCSVRTLSAFPGRLWVEVDGIPVFEIHHGDLRQAMTGSGPLIERAVAATEAALGSTKASGVMLLR